MHAIALLPRPTDQERERAHRAGAHAVLSHLAELPPLLIPPLPRL
jgi:phosphoglycolate phosphatase-like HAD superfamily hydrolase